MTDKNDFFEDMAVTLDSWVYTASDSLLNIDADLIWTDKMDSFKNIQNILLQNGVEKGDVEQVFSECLRGLAVSFLTIMDGGSALAEKGRVYIVDEADNRLGEGLHDEFVSYLIETDRLE